MVTRKDRKRGKEELQKRREEGDSREKEREQIERQEERETKVESESVISEAVLNRALRQDVLYMLMTLTHAHTQTLRTGAASFSDKVLLPPAVLMPSYDYMIFYIYIYIYTHAYRHMHF